MKGKTVIVGGAGFLGTSIARDLAQTRDVLVVDTASRLQAAAEWLGDTPSAVLEFPDDLSAAPDLIAGADALVCLSWTSTPSSSMNDLAGDALENVVASARIFEEAGRAGVRRVVFASSGGTVYGNPETVPVPEEAARNPLSGYGASKLAAEHFLHVAAARDGFSGVSLRVGNPYGPFQLRGAAIGIIAQFLNSIARGETPEIWGDGMVVRDFLHVDDVISAFRHAVDVADIPSGAYNVGSGQGTSVLDVWALIRTITGTRIDPIHKPSRGFDVETIYLDTRRLRAATGWAPRVSLREGIQRLWDETRTRQVE